MQHQCAANAPKRCPTRSLSALSQDPRALHQSDQTTRSAPTAIP